MNRRRRVYRLLSVAGLVALSGALILTQPKPLAVAANALPDRIHTIASASVVSVEKLDENSFRYVVNGEAETFVGMGYNPIYRYLTDDERAANYQRDFARLCQAGVNHITGWDSDKGYEQDKFDEVTLDAADAAGIGVVMPFYLPVDGDYESDDYQQALMEAAAAKIARFKDHPAMRMWAVGNEVLVEMESPRDQAAFLSFYPRIADLFHTLDPNHPVIYREAEDVFVPMIRSVLSNGPDRPWLQYGTNVYTPRLENILADWPSYGMDRPLFVSEFGAEPEWPGGRAAGYAEMWRTIRAQPDYVLGGAPYTWTTEGPEPTDKKWGLMNGDGEPVDDAFAQLATEWLKEDGSSCRQD